MQRDIEFRTDESNRDTKRGLIREEILPRLRELHPAADRNLLATRARAGRPRSTSCSHRPPDRGGSISAAA